MTLTVTDEPPDRPEWVVETLRLVTEWVARRRAELVARVAAASDAELVTGTDLDWGVGQVATHVLLVDRGVCQIALRLAQGQRPGNTGQPRVAAAGVARARIVELAAKAEEAARTLRESFPAEPDVQATARHPYYGDLNTFGWLLTIPNHYAAHLDALERGTKSAL